MENNEKYANGKIYRITCNITGLCYVGSTCDTLSKRLRGHGKDYKGYLNGSQKYVTSFEILKNDDYQISLLQAYPCENKRELLDREGWYQKKYWDRSVNKIQNGITKQESDKKYYANNKEEKNKKTKQYYQENKEESNKDRNTKVECECGYQYTKRNKARHMKSTVHTNWLNE